MKMTATTNSSFWLILLVTLGLSYAVMAEDVLKESPYSIVIDGGSTGSRLHIFEFVVVNNRTGETDCRRVGSQRSFQPLSDFGGSDPTTVADHIMHVFEFAAQMIPDEYHEATSVKFAATAGMRLLTEVEQKGVYDALYQGLLENEKFVFHGLQREDLFTLGGELEGFYGAVAANFLVGMIDTKLGVGQSDDDGPLGALDMGGSSTQIVYMPAGGQGGQPQASPSQLVPTDFFSTSYLEYGVDRFRERLWDTWVKARKKEDESYGDDSCSTKIIDNPCTFVGYEIEWKGYRMIGTGNASACVEQVQRLIPHYEPDETLGGKVGGVEHPPIKGKFFAMSLFFFSLDSLRALSGPSTEAYEALNLSWPNPSIQELYDALDGLCSRSWHEDLAEIQHEAHAYTRAEVLPHRCMESVYMVTLLRDGYGFEPSSRDITFTFLVDGDEVEWSLGLALSMHAEQHRFQEEQEQDTEANITRGNCEPEAVSSRS